MFNTCIIRVVRDLLNPISYDLPTQVSRDDLNPQKKKKKKKKKKKITLF
ncbi:hypothetical protein HanPI659440_Chr01g0003101 [Helianthus annuus]|nr:hypothetical protein HanPI659440_Chr01g0003101 [Helianthus annuus]